MKKKIYILNVSYIIKGKLIKLKNKIVFFTKKAKTFKKINKWKIFFNLLNLINMIRFVKF